MFDKPGMVPLYRTLKLLIGLNQNGTWPGAGPLANPVRNITTASQLTTGVQLRKRRKIQRFLNSGPRRVEKPRAPAANAPGRTSDHLPICRDCLDLSLTDPEACRCGTGGTKAGRPGASRYSTRGTARPLVRKITRFFAGAGRQTQTP
jgi:hypothetical protein